jgi:hypothetical protein
LEALAKYASAIPANKVKMTLQAEIDDSDKIIDFRIDEENRQILQQQKIPHLPTYAHWAFTGSGCSLVQVILNLRNLNSFKSRNWVFF